MGLMDLFQSSLGGGLSGGLSAGVAPKVNPLAGFESWLDPRRNAIIGFGTGLASGDTPAEGIAAGLQGAMQGRQADTAYATQKKAEAERLSQINQTTAWIKTNYPQYANLPPDQGFKLATQMMGQQAKLGGDAPSTVQEWEYFNRLSPEDQGNYLRMKRANPYLNTGTGFVQPDPMNPGVPAGPAIPIDNVTPAYDTAYGKGLGENALAAGSLESKMPKLRSTVEQLRTLAKTATYTWAGQGIDEAKKQLGMNPSQAAIDRAAYIAIVDNQILPLLRDTFGAQFTVKEGETLRATLGDPNKSPAEKMAVLDAFIAQKEADVKAMESRIPGQPTQAPGANNDPLGIRP